MIKYFTLLLFSGVFFLASCKDSGVGTSPKDSGITLTEGDTSALPPPPLDSVVVSPKVQDTVDKMMKTAPTNIKLTLDTSKK